ncbi:branched-chain-amino-acid aminotransferase [Acrocarpospora phusangensis]|uniref:Branched-chain-amino-acid aminotransferase n=1 Tax=Acrocarpospora phusangensis TaxID=1070424 RepID=A0A919QF79_9ACTN|nr:branched-chain amino acid aminotransferase [Acrocarpospora phusangensis]GIH27653.1 branched-chain-amino-acid aminotransferase [Acrocarpospora phusangensis]
MTTDTVAVRQGEALAGAQIGDFTEHMVVMRWRHGSGWSAPELRRHQELALSPATAALHYGQSIIEGLKAHRQPDGGLAVFRPRDHARRLQRSARRMSMPVLPEDDFVTAVETLAAADQAWLSDDPGHSFYLRPFMFASEANLVPRPAREFTFAVISFVIGSYFGQDVESLSAWVCRDFPRAFPGGTGDVKVAGNYAPTLLAQERARQADCHQVVWLDAAERRWVEEMGSANLFFVRGSGPGAVLVTPELTGSFLPGITRDTTLALARDLGYRTAEERVSVDRWRAGCESGLITETFACGTAAVVTSVGRVRDETGDWTVGDGTPGPVTRRIRQALVDCHHGLIPDTHGWRHPVPPAARP